MPELPLSVVYPVKYQKKAWLLRPGRRTELGVAGDLVSIDTSMIGRWEKWKTY